MELFPPSLIGQYLKDSFSDETTFQENETFFGAFFTSKMISVLPLTVAQAIIDRIIGIFGSPEMLHFDQSPEFQNSVVDSTATFHTTGV